MQSNTTWFSLSLLSLKCPTLDKSLLSNAAKQTSLSCCERWILKTLLSPWDNTHSSLHLQPCESSPSPSLVIPTGSHPCTGRIKIILLCLEEMPSPLWPRLLLLPSTISQWQQNSQKAQGGATASLGRAGRRREYQFQPGSCSAK